MLICAEANGPTTLRVVELVACVKGAPPIFESRTCSPTCFKEHVSIFSALSAYIYEVEANSNLSSISLLYIL